jgi:hypothetical protein
MEYNHDMAVANGVAISPGATCWSVGDVVQTGAATAE